MQVTGSVVKPLNLSLSRNQYEQLLETIKNLFKVPHDLARPPTSVGVINSTTTENGMNEMDIANQPFELDDKFKRRLFNPPITYERKTFVEPKVSFELPIFIIQLKNELNDPLIDIVFRDFNFNYEMNNMYETNIQVSITFHKFKNTKRIISSLLVFHIFLRYPCDH